MFSQGFDRRNQQAISNRKPIQTTEGRNVSYIDKVVGFEEDKWSEYSK